MAAMLRKDIPLLTVNILFEEVPEGGTIRNQNRRKLTIKRRKRLMRRILC